MFCVLCYWVAYYDPELGSLSKFLALSGIDCVITKMTVSVRRVTELSVSLAVTLTGSILIFRLLITQGLK